MGGILGGAEAVGEGVGGGAEGLFGVDFEGAGEADGGPEEGADGAGRVGGGER